MKRLLFILYLVLSAFSCGILKYSFVENITGKEKQEFLKGITKQYIKRRGEIRGVFVEKNISYNFIANYDLSTKYIRLRFYSLLQSKDLIFDVYMKDNDKEYDFFKDSFFSVKIGNLLDRFYYIFDIYNKNVNIKVTSEDYIVTIDKNKNYRKYDNMQIIKKENRSYKVKYFYENAVLKKIEFKHNFRIFYLILKSADKPSQQLK